MKDETLKREKRSHCQGEECGAGITYCCKDCPDRNICAEVCDGPEDGTIDGPCEFRI